MADSTAFESPYGGCCAAGNWRHDEGDHVLVEEGPEIDRSELTVPMLTGRGGEHLHLFEAGQKRKTPSPESGTPSRLCSCDGDIRSPENPAGTPEAASSMERAPAHECVNQKRSMSSTVREPCPLLFEPIE